MSLRVYISRDTTAVAVGAERVVQRFEVEATQAELSYELVRNGSRGAFGLEPLLEVDSVRGRVGFAAVMPEDIPEVIRCVKEGVFDHPKYVGLITEIPWLSNQTRVTFKRCGEGAPTDLKNYQRLGGYEGLKNALGLSSQAIVDEIKASGLRGRGGAAFPTGIKWQTVLDTDSDQKYIVCNADEGDSGTFADRLLMEGDPYQLI